MKVSKLSALSIILLTMVLGFSMQTHAALQLLGTDSQGNRLIYDSDLDITWYDYTTGGSWYNMNSWANSLSVTFGSNTYTDWRLPGTYGPDCYGMNCTNGELGHLYYTELGNAPLNGLTNTGDFQNLRNEWYWSGTEFGALEAWIFKADDGSQDNISKGDPYFALAVMDGKALAVVPEPVSSTLFILGAATMGFRVYRKKVINS